MGKSSRFLQDVSKSAKESRLDFSGIKNFLGIGKDAKKESLKKEKEDKVRKALKKKKDERKKRNLASNSDSKKSIAEQINFGGNYE